MAHKEYFLTDVYTDLLHRPCGIRDQGLDGLLEYETIYLRFIYTFLSCFISTY